MYTHFLTIPLVPSPRLVVSRSWEFQLAEFWDQLWPPWSSSIAGPARFPWFGLDPTLWLVHYKTATRCNGHDAQDTLSRNILHQRKIRFSYHISRTFDHIIIENKSITRFDTFRKMRELACNVVWNLYQLSWNFFIIYIVRILFKKIYIRFARNFNLIMSKTARDFASHLLTWLWCATITWSPEDALSKRTCSSPFTPGRR